MQNRKVYFLLFLVVVVSSLPERSLAAGTPDTADLWHTRANCEASCTAPGQSCVKEINGDYKWRCICSEESIIKQVLQDYERRVRPDRDELTVVKHRIELIGISAVADPMGVRDNYIRLAIFEDVFWSDSRLSWNTDRCDIKEVRVAKDDVWLPQVFNYFSVKPTVNKVDGALVSIQSNGDTGYTVSKEIDFACNVYEARPGDTFPCKITFGSWNYPADEIVFEVTSENGGFSMDHYQDLFRRFSVIDSSSELVNRTFGSYPKPWSTIDYTITFKANKF